MRAYDSAQARTRIGASPSYEEARERMAPAVVKPVAAGRSSPCAERPLTARDLRSGGCAPMASCRSGRWPGYSAYRRPWYIVVLW